MDDSELPERISTSQFFTPRRPSAPPGVVNNRSRMVSLRLPHDQVADLAEVGRGLGLTLSDTLRTVLQWGLDTNKARRAREQDTRNPD